MIQTPALSFLNIQEAAEALGIHPNNLSALARAGIVPAGKVGKEWRFIDVDIAEYLRSQYPANRPKNTVLPTKTTKPRMSADKTNEDALEELLRPAIKRKK